MSNPIANTFMIATRTGDIPAKNPAMPYPTQGQSGGAVRDGRVHRMGLRAGALIVRILRA